MQLPRDAVLLRIFIGEDARFEHQPLFEAIVLKARELELAGATVLRSPMGYGQPRRLHTTKILNLSEDLPIVIEIVDVQDKDRCIPANPQSDDDERARHSGKGPSAAIRKTSSRRRPRVLATGKT